MKSKRRATLSGGPTPERFQHTPLQRDVLTPAGGPCIARHRVKPVLTPFEARRDIIEEASALPESTRVRSLRRKLTALDRILEDNEAEALDRLLSCMEELSNVRSVIQPGVQVRAAAYGRLPFSERVQREIAALSFVTKLLTPLERTLVEIVSCGLPSHGGKLDGGKDRRLLLMLKALASAIEIHYGAANAELRSAPRSGAR